MDGVILASCVAKAGDLRLPVGFPLPITLVDREVPGLPVDSVLVDNVLGAREATAHLIAEGAQRLACITGPAGVSTAAQRLQGFLESLKAAGVPRRQAVYRQADYRV